jgi:hypothetical protein
VIALAIAGEIGSSAASSQEQPPKPKDPTSVMIVVLENYNGKRTMETTPIGESACRHAIRVFKEVGPFNITIHSSDRRNIAVSGRAIEIQCVLPDASVVGTHPN